MYSEILTYSPSVLHRRAFIHTYIDGKRWRLYNGKQLGVDCHPNRCTNHKDRNRELKRLERELHNRLSKGWRPSNPAADKNVNAITALTELIKIINTQNYSAVYKRDLTVTIKQFIQYLRTKRRESNNISQLLTSTIEEFLLQFSTSGTYYMNKRRFLCTRFSKLITLGLCTNNPVKNTSRRDVRATLNQSYKPDQIIKVLDYLKESYKNLYLCALLMYGTLLRPHQEIRLLRRMDLSEDLHYILLDGYRNKSGSIRKAPIATYVRKALLDLGIEQLQPTENIFTKTNKPFNKYYFSLMWSRAKKGMMKLNLVNSMQTLYSIRHSAAINVFDRSQNLHMIQALFQHSSLTVSLTYLRSIGQERMYDPADLPTLDIN